MLPVPIGSVTFQVILDKNDKTEQTYKYQQHVFTWEDIPEYGKTVFSSDTEAMVIAMEKTNNKK